MPFNGIEKETKEVRISLVIPTFNSEDNNICMLSGKLSSALANNDLEYEIKFVDDGLGNATFEKSRSLKANEYLEIII